MTSWRPNDSDDTYSFLTQIESLELLSLDFLTWPSNLAAMLLVGEVERFASAIQFVSDAIGKLMGLNGSSIAVHDNVSEKYFVFYQFFIIISLLTKR